VHAVAFLDLDLKLNKKWRVSPFARMEASNATLGYVYHDRDGKNCVGELQSFTRGYLERNQLNVTYAIPDDNVWYFKGCALFFEVAFWASTAVREFAIAWEDTALVYFNRSDGKAARCCISISTDAKMPFIFRAKTVLNDRKHIFVPRSRGAHRCRGMGLASWWNICIRTITSDSMGCPWWMKKQGQMCRATDTKNV
jgi:hypothetical protein